MKKLSKKKKNNLPLFLFLIISFIITSLTVGYSTSSKTFAINGAALVDQVPMFVSLTYKEYKKAAMLH